MKHLRMIGASVFAALFSVAGSAGAQTPSAGPPPPPPAAMPAPKPAAAPGSRRRGQARRRAAAAKPAAGSGRRQPAAPHRGRRRRRPRRPSRPPELDQLKMFEGTWRCDGKQPAGPMGPEQVYKSSFKGKKDVDNFWLAFEYAQKKSKVHTMPITAKGFLGYDPATKKYVTMGVDNMGGSISESSPGWEADKLVFTGDGQMGGQKISFRETYTKKGDKADDLVGRDEDGEGLDPRRHRHLQEVAALRRPLVRGRRFCQTDDPDAGPELGDHVGAELGGHAGQDLRPQQRQLMRQRRRGDAHEQRRAGQPLGLRPGAEVLADGARVAVERPELARPAGAAEARQDLAHQRVAGDRRRRLRADRAAGAWPRGREPYRRPSVGIAAGYGPGPRDRNGKSQRQTGRTSVMFAPCHEQIISTAGAPKAIGPYSQAVVAPAGRLLFCSGQIPLDPRPARWSGRATCACRPSG